MRKQTGITLIALVVTIIVLIILAGVSIAMLTGENGIITKARSSAVKTESAAQEEKGKLESLLVPIDDYFPKSPSTNPPEDPPVETKELEIGDTIIYKEIEWNVTNIENGIVTMSVKTPYGEFAWKAEGETDDDEYDKELSVIDDYCQENLGNEELAINVTAAEESQGAADVEYYIRKITRVTNACGDQHYYISTTGEETYNDGFATFAVWPIATLPGSLITYENDSFIVKE